MSGKKGAKHIRWHERLQIEAMLKANVPKTTIATVLNKAYSTIKKEINRGMCKQQINECDFEYRYCPEIAEQKYQERSKVKGPDLKIGSDLSFSNFLQNNIIKDHYSRAAALCEAKKAGYNTTICVSTLYNYIYSGNVFFRLSYSHLHLKGQRRYIKQAKRRAARLSYGMSIENRSPAVLRRSSFGHWEMDSIIGCQGTKRTLLVLTERQTRIGILKLLPDHKSQSVVNAINSLERQYGDAFYDVFKSITVDNGTEFADVSGIERSCRKRGKRTQLYFCHPYSPHERGSNENMNKIIRRFFPKSTNFDKITLCEVNSVQTWINNYPRRILKWKSAMEVASKYIPIAA